jgi:hypothetical protein
MAIVAYVYDRAWWILWQIHNVLWFQCELQNNDISKAALTMNNFSVNSVISTIKENNLISVYNQIGSTEKLLIEWYIRWFDATLTTTTIRIEDKLSILDDRCLYTDITITDTVQNVLATVFGYINARWDNYITVSCNVTDTVTKAYKRGDSVLTILNDLRNNTYQYTIKGNVLYFNYSLGIDRSVVWPNYFEFNWDILNPMQRNILSASVSADIKSMCNCWVDTTNWTSFEDATSIANYWRIERVVNNDGSGTQSAQWFVNDRKVSIREFEIEPDNQDFRSCDIWDTVKVYINSWNDIMFYNGTMTVVWKTFTSWELDKVKIKVWQSKVTTNGIYDVIRDLNKRILKVENRI